MASCILYTVIDFIEKCRRGIKRKNHFLMLTQWPTIRSYRRSYLQRTFLQNNISKHEFLKTFFVLFLWRNFVSIYVLYTVEQGKTNNFTAIFSYEASVDNALSNVKGLPPVTSCDKPPRKFVHPATG